MASCLQNGQGVHGRGDCQQVPTSGTHRARVIYIIEQWTLRIWLRQSASNRHRNFQLIFAPGSMYVRVRTKDGNFLPKLRDLGIPYDEIPPWMLELHTGPPLKW